MSEVERESEDCLLARHPECPGVVTVAGSLNVKVNRPCQCECHRLV